MYSPITYSLSFVLLSYRYNGMLFITRKQRLHMFISCVNRLMLGSNNRSYALKQTCKFYLQVIILVPVTFFLPPDIGGLNARRYLSLLVSAFWKTSLHNFSAMSVKFSWINAKLLKPYPNIMSQKSLTQHFNVHVTTLCQWF